MPIRKRSVSASVGESYLTGNILNGVLNCAWNKTSAEPKLLEIANTSEVKFNIDTLNPLVLRFADGWDDNDRPKGIIKQLSTPPPNINLSSKANCHVQIVAKVVNGELTITTHDVYDPGWNTWTNIIPTFSSYSSVNGWGVSLEGWRYSSAYEGWMALDKNESSAYRPDSGGGSLVVSSPFPISLARVGTRGGASMTFAMSVKKEITDNWIGVGNLSVGNGWSYTTMTDSRMLDCYSYFRVSIGDSSSLYELAFNERPVVKYFRSLNKVKDRSDNEQLWINLGYATIDGSGNITALYHYTDLRNNYPGGMRVEA